MKSIEFYYDEICKLRLDFEVYSFAKRNGMIPRDEMSDTQNLMKWLNEEHQILDDVEKKYLRTVIEPFRDRITGIKKKQLSWRRL